MLHLHYKNYNNLQQVLYVKLALQQDLTSTILFAPVATGSGRMDKQ